MNKLDRRSFLMFSGGALLAAACGSGGEDAPASSYAGSTGPDPNRRVTLRLGYFPNLNHVQPNVGLENGAFARALGESVMLESWVAQRWGLQSS